MAYSGLTFPNVAFQLAMTFQKQLKIVFRIQQTLVPSSPTLAGQWCIFARADYAQCAVLRRNIFLPMPVDAASAFRNDATAVEVVVPVLDNAKKSEIF